MFGFIVGVLMLFALVSGTMVPAWPELYVRRKDRPRLYWLHVAGLVFVLAVCINLVLRNWPEAKLPPLY